MPNVVNFNKAKLSLMAFTSREDFAEFMQKMDGLFNRARRYPVFYLLADSEAKQEDIHSIETFLRDTIQKTDDVEMIFRNIQKRRFDELNEYL